MEGSRHLESILSLGWTAEGTLGLPLDLIETIAEAVGCVMIRSRHCQHQGTEYHRNGIGMLQSLQGSFGERSRMPYLLLPYADKTAKATHKQDYSASLGAF